MGRDEDRSVLKRKRKGGASKGEQRGVSKNTTLEKTKAVFKTGLYETVGGGFRFRERAPGEERGGGYHRTNLELTQANAHKNS